jgi:hypothetical protein
MARCGPGGIGHVARLFRGAGTAVQGFTSGSAIDELSEQVTLRLGPSAGRRLAASTLAPPFILLDGS